MESNSILRIVGVDEDLMGISDFEMGWSSEKQDWCRKMGVRKKRSDKKL